MEVFLALLAWKTNRPVKLTYTREEMGYGRHKRHPYVLKYRTGARKDGTLTAMEAEIVSDAGAYVYLSPWVLIYSTVHATGPYLIPNVKVDARSVLTNNIMTSAFRGFGGMQTVVAYEAQMDELARRLGLDPLELRKKNFLKTGDVTASYQEITSEVRLEECARKALEALGEKAVASSPRRKVGRGLACCWQSYGRMTYLHDTSNCWVNLEMDGSAVVRTGIPDLGGGQRESIRAIVAEVLGLAGGGGAGDLHRLPGHAAVRHGDRHAGPVHVRQRGQAGGRERAPDRRREGRGDARACARRSWSSGTRPCSPGRTRVRSWPWPK